MSVPDALRSYIVDFFLTLMYERDIQGDRQLIEVSLKKFNSRGIPGLKTALEGVQSGRVKIVDVDNVIQEWASNFGFEIELDTAIFLRQVLRELNSAAKP